MTPWRRQNSPMLTHPSKYICTEITVQSIHVTCASGTVKSEQREPGKKVNKGEMNERKKTPKNRSLLTLLEFMNYRLRAQCFVDMRALGL